MSTSSGGQDADAFGAIILAAVGQYTWAGSGREGPCTHSAPWELQKLCRAGAGLPLVGEEPEVWGDPVLLTKIQEARAHSFHYAAAPTEFLGWRHPSMWQSQDWTPACPLAMF